MQKNPFMPSLRPPRDADDDLSDESGSESSSSGPQPHCSRMRTIGQQQHRWPASAAIAQHARAGAQSEADAERTAVDWENIAQRLIAFPVANGRCAPQHITLHHTMLQPNSL